MIVTFSNHDAFFDFGLVCPSRLLLLAVSAHEHFLDVFHSPLPIGFFLHWPFFSFLLPPLLFEPFLVLLLEVFADDAQHFPDFLSGLVEQKSHSPV